MSVQPFSYDDPEAQDVAPLPKGTRCEVEIVGGRWVSGKDKNGNDYGFASVMLAPMGEFDKFSISGETLNHFDDYEEDPSDSAREKRIKLGRRRRAKAALAHFGKGFGIPAEELISVIENAREDAQNGRAVDENFDPWVGLTADVISDQDKNGYAFVATYLTDEVEEGGKKKK